MDMDCDIKIPIEVLNNLDIVIKYQNIRLLSQICDYMKWNKDLVKKLIKI